MVCKHKRKKKPLAKNCSHLQEFILPVHARKVKLENLRNEAEKRKTKANNRTGSSIRNLV